MQVSTRPPSHHLEACSPECPEATIFDVELPLYGVLRSWGTVRRGTITPPIDQQEEPIDRGFLEEAPARPGG
jgi:hypothetical protein